MPYYCTVPRCTSMAGKAKNVSFHQFPRDEELAKLWNNILKRGKPYTKYSKVCSLHFKPEDYTITSAGKNKGQWRTLRKDAIPSQNLPSDTPAPYTRRQSGAWVQSNVPAIDQQIHQQAQHLAQAIYMQTMLAMQSVGVQDAMGLNSGCNDEKNDPKSPSSFPDDLLITPEDLGFETESSRTLSSFELPLHCYEESELPSSNRAIKLPQPTEETQPPSPNTSKTPENNPQPEIDIQEPDMSNQELHTTHRTDHDSNQTLQKTSYKCDDCSKCFKDPDVFILHKRTHKSDPEVNGKENFDLNTLKPEMLKSNPILANLLKNTMERNIFNSNIFEKQLLVSFSSMENYLHSVNKNDFNEDDDCDNSDLSESLEDSNLVIDENVA